MKFTITKASEPDYKEIKDFNTLEELLEFIKSLTDLMEKKEGDTVFPFEGVIISEEGDSWYIEIYDYYKE